MLEIVQLMDGCYRVTIDFVSHGFAMHREFTFKPCESSAEVDPSGEKIVLELKQDYSEE